MKVQCLDGTPPPLVVLCGQEYNCNPECISDKYFIPAIHDFYIQTFFKTSTDPIVAFLDENANIIAGNFESEIKKGIQTYKIIVDSVPTKCFQVKITVGDISYCSQFFSKPECKDEYVSFEGIYSKKDCVGQDYTTMFSNKLSLKGSLKYYTTTIEEDGPVDIYRFYFSEAIPYFLYKYLMNVIIGSPQIKVNDQEYEYSGNGNAQPLKSGKYAPILEFRKPCYGNKLVCEN
jgi:hypothetical protein